MSELKQKIILEGADKSGKSTLAKLLREEYPYLDIADRSFISDRVYANKFKRTAYLGVDINTYLSYWEQFHANMLDTKIILCVASWDTLAKRAIEHNEEFCRNRTYEQVKNYLGEDQIAFCNAVKAMSLIYGFRFLELNTEINSIKSSLTEIKRFINYDRINKRL